MAFIRLRFILPFILSLGTYALIGTEPDPSPADLATELQFEEAIRSALESSSSITSYFQNHFEELLLKKGIPVKDLLISLSDRDAKIPTGGKSGSSFIITKDKRFVLKTISEDEFETFKGIAKNYFAYLKAYPESLLINFYGLYKVEGLIPRYLLLMPNLIPKKTSTTKIFDLKGRAKKPNHKNPRMIDDNTLPDPPPFTILKKANAQIMKDIDFLEKEGLLDYSLFIVGQEGLAPGIYLIDFLTTYNWKKQVAHFFKQSLYKEQQLSTIPPDKYAARMRAFINRCSEY